jgi:uncharacterized protein (DUF2267 family)
VDEFIQQMTSKLGIDDSTAKQATAQTMNFVKGQVDASLFEQILKQVPGLEMITELMKSGQTQSTGKDKPQEEAGGGLFGAIAGMAGAYLGKDAAQGLDLINNLKKLGLSMEDITKFVTSLIEFLKKNVSPELVQKVLAQIPALAKMMK